jgi:hypothetical protein
MRNHFTNAALPAATPSETIPHAPQVSGGDTLASLDNENWIAHYAENVTRSADHVAVWTQYLTRRYPFETRMEASLNSAEAALLRALQIIRKTRLTYESKGEA